MLTFSCILKGSELTSHLRLPLAPAPGWSCWREGRELESPYPGDARPLKGGAKHLPCICCLTQQTREIKVLSRALASSLSTEEIYPHWVYLNSQWRAERSLISIYSPSSLERWNFTARTADFTLYSDSVYLIWKRSVRKEQSTSQDLFILILMLPVPILVICQSPSLTPHKHNLLLP